MDLHTRIACLALYVWMALIVCLVLPGVVLVGTSLNEAGRYEVVRLQSQ